MDASEFAYPGPKPQSRETAIVMLADGVESATRVLQDPTPERIRATIDAIVQARIEEGQLDQCTLTLRDLERSKAAFGRILIGMYHRRIEYPSGVRAREPLPAADVEGTIPLRAGNRAATEKRQSDRVDADGVRSDAARELPR